MFCFVKGVKETVRKKYFFFDIDGTLAPGLTRIMPADTRRCLAQLKARGHFISLATGRLQKDAAMFAEQYGISSLVADGGNSVTLDGVLRVMKGLPREDCLRFLDQLEAKGIPWAITTVNERVRFTADKRFRAYVDDGYFDTVMVDGLDYRRQDSFYKIFVPTMAGEVDFGALPVVHYSSACTFVEPTDKAAGIKEAMAMMRAPLEDVVVFGDGSNDMGMFLPQWRAIAMGNATPQLKARASFVTKDCDDGGTAYACGKFGWI